MSNVPVSFVNDLVQSGLMTTALAVQEAAAEQTNTATSGSVAGVANSSWGSAIPVLIGHTRTLALPLWVGDPVATIDGSGNETDTIDFACYIGRPGPREATATLLRMWFDNVLVYDSADASKTTLAGAPVSFKFYDGTQTEPDPTMVAANGPATPAFTGTMYVVFSDLLTRSINAETTVTQFTALPEVQCEVIQTAAITETGATVYEFAGALPPADGVAHYNYLSSKTGIYYILTDTLLSLYNSGDMQFIGRAAPQKFGTNQGDIASRFSPNVLTQDGAFIVVGGGSNWIAYDPLTGAIVANTQGRDLNGKNLPSEFGDVLDLANGFLLSDNIQEFLVFYDGSNFYASDMDPWFALYEGTKINDNVANLSDIPTFDAVGMSYVTGNGCNKIRRIVMTQGGSKELQSQVALITADGSKRKIMKGTQADVLIELDNNESFGAVLLDHADNTKVYALLRTPTGSELRCYATFYYWNPQTGGTAPVTTPAIYNNFDLLTELSRTPIPAIQFNDRPTYQGVQYRDKRYPTVAYYGNESFIVLNFKTGTFVQYQSGHYFDPSGDVIGSFNTWQASMIKLGPNNAFLCDGMEYYGNTPVTWPAKLIPKGVTDSEKPYSLADLYTDICLLVGYELGEISCTGMDDTITGCQLNKTTSFNDLMPHLNATFRVYM